MDFEKTVLIVDDAQMNLLSAQRFLQTKYHVDTASSGAMALEYLKTHTPSLILLDIIMPEMDGFQTFEKIKEDPMTADIPVIFLTADTDRSCELKGFRMGAMDFIAKPFVPEIMVSRVDRIIRFHEMKNDLLRQVEEKTEEARRDNLTGLYNRGYVENEVNRYLSLDNRRGILFILDIDNFKAVNDTFGHIAGDSVLVRFAEKLKCVIRENDIACRIGGDEFIMFFPGSMTGELAEEKGMQLIRYYEEALEECRVKGIRTGISVGACMAPANGRDFMTLYKNADRALYFVKENGKKDFHLYHESDPVGETGIMVSTEMDITQLVSIIREHRLAKGAFEIEYEGFRNIYQFLTRCIDRTHQDVQLVLMTLYLSSGRSPEPGIVNDGMQILGEHITRSLRKGDVATQFSSSQFLVLLMDTDMANATMVVDRIIEKFYGDEDSLKVKYDIRSLGPMKG